MSSPSGTRQEPASATAADGEGDTSSSFDSGSSASDESAHVQSICRWRTPEFHDRECSRFFDCPSHIVGRSMATDEAVHEPNTPPSGSRRGSRDGGDEAEIDTLTPRIALMGLRYGQGSASASNVQLDSPNSGLPVPPRTSSMAAPNSSSPSLLHLGSIESRSSSFGPSVPRMESEPGSSDSIDQSRALPSLPAGSRATGGGGSVRGAVTSERRMSALPALPPSAGEALSPSEFTVPRWQPDAEVTYCPICHTQFSIFVRKHHCRKCGRVVCNSCSPHRIIIPHQYIVRAPGSEVPLPPNMSLHVPGLSGNYFDTFGSSGGERVRLCNPCVPDPNTAPPQSPLAPMLSPSSRSSHRGSRNSLGDAYGPAPFPPMPHGSRYPSNTSFDPSRMIPPRGRSITTLVPSVSQGSQEHGTESPGMTLGQFLMSGPSRLPPSSFPTRYSSLEEPSSSRPRRGLRVRRIAEEDECPVCHRELPSRDLADFESAREAHINACIQNHSTYGSPRGGGGGNGNHQTAAEPAPRRTGMYTYSATEKDCIDDAECTICLEEFAVGVSMARLECLCRFHRSCITAWFVNHPGRCPVHQHDGFGY